MTVTILLYSPAKPPPNVAITPPSTTAFPLKNTDSKTRLAHSLEHGVPHPPHLRPEARSLSVHTHSDTQCGSNTIGEEITQPDVC
jgi:hypothetical protein